MGGCQEATGGNVSSSILQNLCTIVANACVTIYQKSIRSVEPQERRRRDIRAHKPSADTPSRSLRLPRQSRYLLPCSNMNVAGSSRYLACTCRAWPFSYFFVPTCRHGGFRIACCLQIAHPGMSKSVNYRSNREAACCLSLSPVFPNPCPIEY